MVNTRTPRRRRRASIAAFGAFITLPAATALVADGNVTARPETAARTTPAAAPTVGTRVQSIEDRGGLSVLARPGKANVINIALSNTTFTVRDTGDDVVAGPGCESIDAHTARCVAFGQPVRIDTGDLDDTVVAPFPLPTDVSAGSGNDTITTGSAADELRGGLGNDQLTAGAGADLLDGNLGADVMKGQSGRDTLLGVGRADEADVLSGGPDTDIADYSGRDEDLTISLDDVANDGEPGEQDNVRNDVEEIEGGDGGDTLTGSNMVAVTNRLLGGPGGDTLVGRAGPDRMFAQEGNDVLDGGSGNDDLDGGPNADTIIGGPDRDEVLYSSRANRVVVDIDDVADDGETNEKDNVRTDVEDITADKDPTASRAARPRTDSRPDRAMTSSTVGWVQTSSVVAPASTASRTRHVRRESSPTSTESTTTASATRRTTSPTTSRASSAAATTIFSAAATSATTTSPVALVTTSCSASAETTISSVTPASMVSAAVRVRTTSPTGDPTTTARTVARRPSASKM